MQVVTITGGTGMVGTTLREALLKKGFEVVVLARDAAEQAAKHGKPGLDFAHWNVEKGQIDTSRSLARSQYLVHLAGDNLAKGRWTSKKKQRIVASRVESGALLVKAMEECESPVRTVVSANAIGWYGPDPVIPNPHPFVESDPPSNDFLGQTCVRWREALVPVAAQGRRLVVLRTGIVVSDRGGAMDEFRKYRRFGLATILGSGRQVYSWIHLDDLVKMYIAAMENEAMNGDYNAVAPHPVANREFVMEFARSEGKGFIPVRVPAFILQTLLGEKSGEVLKSATVSAAKILSTGFQFDRGRIEEAFLKSPGG